MKHTWMSMLALCAALSGCAAAAPEAGELGVSESELTVQECATQRDTCVRQFGFLGALTICPAQYAGCMATASNGLPAEVVNAVGRAAECTDEFADCNAGATSAVQLAACAEDQAQCVAAILDVEIPSVVTGTTACVEASVDCINAAETVGDLTLCGGDLAECAVEQVGTVVPEEVVEVIDGVNDCNVELNACVQAAATPAALTACGEDQAQCIAGTLNVQLPNIPVSEVVECTDSAASCALNVESLRDVANCADSLLECTADVVDALDAPPVLDCGQVWTACMFRNPFGFFVCAAERRACDESKR